MRWLLCLLLLSAPAFGDELCTTSTLNTCGSGSGGGSSLPVADTTSVVEGSSDGTKEIRFEVDGLTTGTTRVLTVPDADLTLVGTTTTQTLTNKTLSSPSVSGGVWPTTGPTMNDDVYLMIGTVSDGRIGHSTWTPHNNRLAVIGSESLSVNFMANADYLVNVGEGVCGASSACTHNTYSFWGASPGVAGTKLQQIWHDGTNAHIWTPLGGTLGLRYAVVANTGSLTPTVGTQSDQTGAVITNTGDADGSTITLPDDPLAGTVFRVSVTVAQTLTLAPNTGETLYLGSDQCVASITASAIGSALEVYAASGGSGAQWHTIASAGWTCND